jgi:hypothetical protein
MQLKKGIFNLTTTQHHSTGNFATFSATRILRNGIMGRKVGSKLPFRIIFRAYISQRRIPKMPGL